MARVKHPSAEARKRAALPGYHFLALDKDLVLALRRKGLVWGATFLTSVDLHHFEVAQSPLDP